MADNRQRTLIASTPTPDRLLELYEGPQIQDLYADGFGRVLAGAQVTKLELISVVGARESSGSTPPVEEREVRFRLTVPTASLLEACVNILAGAASSLELMESATQGYKKVILDGLERANAIKLR